MYIDLTREIVNNLPVFPGDKAVSIKKTHSLSKDGYRNFRIDTEMHIGTHIDSPMHITDSTTYLSEYSINTFFGNGITVDINSNPEIYKSKINKETFVLFDTGMDSKFGKDEYFENYPILCEDWVNLIIAKKVKGVGFDSPSPDKYPFEIHKKLLKNGIFIIENLTNIRQIEKNKIFELIVLHLKTRTDGAPVRAVAKIE
ncbi:MAG: cyclase [Candidatus Cloacimonadota bacterium]|nr:MAG: cyclase [Candidatus Cloacimonadota bacterium]PIE79295.1 MAG: cyclase [Candidatus Delongbacteria bacterium]